MLYAQIGWNQMHFTMKREKNTIKQIKKLNK